MSSIQLTRAFDSGGVARRLIFYVDGRPAARLRRGDSTRVQAEAGTHSVQVRMDWLRSEPVRVEATGDRTIALTGALTAHAMTFTGSFLRPRSALELRVTGCVGR
ncbi:hypothetical protein [Micromonospora sp. WMMD980]|uniref:hypothetical protein n=1 Tax=Micromonospora sp. WMMD980 TaxID=3016088 RepID=UPI002416AC86|nr:hypothetical protein [Micromonospora sp. WMMD980]MDG4800276.1 hypothetical protein [Micromonospora sp. WMMD980]